MPKLQISLTAKKYRTQSDQSAVWEAILLAFSEGRSVQLQREGEKYDWFIDPIAIRVLVIEQNQNRIEEMTKGAKTSET
jgi:hypothetical protein